MYNPFVGNYIMDAFTTEIGGEAYLKAGSLIGMVSLTGGEIRGTVLAPKQRGPTLIGKLGVDRQVNKDLRVRLTGSMYRADKVLSNTLYGGDRAGSRCYYVMENTAATESAQASSGLINPGFKNKVLALQMNPFVKYRGLEVFGILERAKGKAMTEVATALLLTLVAVAGLAAYASPAESPILQVRESRGVYSVDAQLQVAEPPEIVRAVLTDYEQIPRFMPDVRKSVVLQRTDSSAVVEQEAVSKMLMFSKRVHLVLEISEQPETIRFRDRCGQSFSLYEGSWTLSELNGRTVVRYRLTAKPSFDVPEFILKRLLRRDAGQMIERLQGEVRWRAVGSAVAAR